MKPFKKDFMLGAATAAHQVEGNNIHSDYWAMEHMQYSQFVEPSGEAVDHYHRYEEDIQMLAKAGLNTYRFSIEWARIEPEKGCFDTAEMQHYKDVITCCKRNHVEPVVTLMHFTSPKWLIEMGGWDNKEVVPLFANYTKYVVENIKDDVHYICTINEANMRLQIASLMERFMKQMMLQAEQKQNEDQMEGQLQVGLNLSNPMELMKLTAMENQKVFGDSNPHTFVSAAGEQGDAIVMKAHKAAKAVIKKGNPEIQVGLTLSLHDLQFVKGGQEKAEAEWNQEFLHYASQIAEDDFLGLQNYTRTVYDANGIVPVEDNSMKTQMDYELYPQALEHVIRRVHETLPELPLFVTENGVAVSDDQLRCQFIDQALAGVQACVADDIPIIGYCYWTLMDNFEWQKGFALTFGLCEVDRSNMKRSPKPSLAHLGSYVGG